MQKHHHLYHFIIFILSFILCISLPFSSFAADDEVQGGVLAQIMALNRFDYVRYSYSRTGSTSTLWESRIGVDYEEISVAGTKVFSNFSNVNLTRWSNLDYYSTIEFKIPLMLGTYSRTDSDPISGSGQFWFNFSKNNYASGIVDYTEEFYLDSVFFKGNKYLDGVTQSYNYFVSSSLSDGTINQDFSDAYSPKFKYLNFSWSYSSGNEEFDDVQSINDYINLDYLYIRVKINMSSFSSAILDVGTRFGLSKLSTVGDQQFQDTIVINLEALQKALDALYLLQQEKFDEVIDLLQSIVDSNKQQQVIQILQDLIHTSPGDPDLPEIEQSDQQTDQIIDRQEQISEALGSVPKEDIDNIGNIINPSTVIVNSDPATVQTALKVIYDWDTLLYILTIVAALMVISYVIFGKKR